MRALILLVLLTLTWPSLTDRPVITITCRNTADLQQLLFTICEEDHLCRHLYSLGSHTSKFWHQLELFDIFTEDEEAAEMWRGRWRPRVVVLYNGTGDSCLVLANTTDSLENSLFNFFVLERLRSHKEYISRHRCAHRNERLLFDSMSKHFRCHCLEGKLCEDNDGRHREILDLIYGLILGIFCIVLVVVIVLSVRLLQRLSQEEAGKGVNK
jgi:hypothetical protein